MGAHLVMKLQRATPFLTTLAWAIACGGRASPDPETGQSGAVGGHVADACAAGKEAYQQKRAQELQQLASIACSSDADCDRLWETNACVSTCGVAAPVTGMDAAGKRLSSFAELACAQCAPIPVPPCVPPSPIQCVQGQCNEVQ